MTCIVAYKKGKVIYMGGDSTSTSGYCEFSRKDPKVFMRDNMLFGFTTSFRMGSLLRYTLEIPTHPSGMSVSRYMNTLFISEVVRCFEDQGYANIRNNEKSGGQFIVGYRKKLYLVDNDFQIAEHIDPYMSVGCGAETALGAINALLTYDKNINPEELLKIALESASKNISGVGSPFNFLKI